MLRERRLRSFSGTRERRDFPSSFFLERECFRNRSSSFLEEEVRLCRFSSFFFGSEGDWDGDLLSPGYLDFLEGDGRVEDLDLTREGVLLLVNFRRKILKMTRKGRGESVSLHL